MESIKKLEEAAKLCLKDLRAMESKISVSEGSLANLDANKAALTAEVEELGGKKAALMEYIGTAEMEFQKKVEARNREFTLKEESLNSERGAVKAELFGARAASADAENERRRYAALYEEYTARLKELDDKRAALSNILK